MPSEGVRWPCSMPPNVGPVHPSLVRDRPMGPTIFCRSSRILLPMAVATASARLDTCKVEVLEPSTSTDRSALSPRRVASARVSNVRRTARFGSRKFQASRDADRAADAYRVAIRLARPLIRRPN